MPKPVCPKCRSTNVVASLAKNSHDNCVTCGHTDFVAKFYEPPGEDTMVAKAQPKPEPYVPPRRRYWWEDKD